MKDIELGPLTPMELEKLPFPALEALEQQLRYKHAVHKAAFLGSRAVMEATQLEWEMVVKCMHGKKLPD